MTLPDLDDHGRLPYADKPYPGSLAEIRDCFVENAPHSKAQRDRLFRALELHVDLVRRRFGTGTKLWVDGGFVTAKDWPPKDVDLVYVMPEAQYIEATAPEHASLWTLLNVSAAQPMVVTERVQPMGGLVDAFPIPDVGVFRETWFDRWSSVKNRAGAIVEGERKGFVEVTL